MASNRPMPKLHNPEVVPPFDAFVQLMADELAANAAKGDRFGWLAAGSGVLLLECHDHLAKLHVAVRELRRRQAGEPARPTPWGGDMEDRVREFAADTANMAMMLLDSLDLIEQPSGVRGGDQDGR